MYKLGKKLLLTVIVTGALMLGSTSPAQCLEYKLPTDESIEKVVIRQKFEDKFLRNIAIEEFYKNNTKITKLDNNKDNIFDLIKEEKNLDANTKEVVYTTFFKGEMISTINSTEKKLDDGTIRTDFFLKEGKLLHFIIKKIDENGAKVIKTYNPDGTPCGFYSEYIREDGIKIIERTGYFVGVDGKIVRNFIKEKIFEKEIENGNKERDYDFGVVGPEGILTFDGVIDKSEFESVWNGQKNVDIYTLRSDGNLFYSKTIKEISIELKPDYKK